MDAAGLTPPTDVDAETVRLQAEEHPLIEDVPPSTPAEHCLRLMHLRAYDEAVSHATGRDVLDVGCNTGYGTMRFVPIARRVVGVDVSPRAIEAARVRASDGHPEVVLSGGFDLPFPDQTFDLVTSFQVLEHVPDPIAFLGELARVTRPGGQIILATPNAATRLYPGMAPWNRFHVHEYVADELRALLRRVFPTVQILGMFGAAELYETEIRRVDAARQRIRRKEDAEARRAANEQEAARRRAAALAPRAARPLPIRIVRGILPEAVRKWLRSMVRPGTNAQRPAPTPTAQPAGTTTEPVELTYATATSSATATATAPEGTPEPAPIDLETFLRFTVNDLYYAASDLDRAMDLLAICDVPSRLESDRVLHSATGPAPHGRPSDPMGM
jgi:ubiquinone/menaquinone biosynthesis C-methylase UbiE